MQQKIVIQVPMTSDKCRSKAMQIAVTLPGVGSVNVEKEKNELVVVGEEVDAVKLANSLRKKFCFANILTVEEVKPPVVAVDKPPDKPATKEEPKCVPCPPAPCGTIYPNSVQLYTCQPVCDPNPPLCSIL